MHGRIKTRTTAEQQELKRKEREKKLIVYRDSIQKVFAKHRKGEYDEEFLEITSQILSSNPDIYTLWNFRREALIVLKESRSVDDVQKAMQGELRLTQQCLQVNPKSYGGWHQRVWVLDHMPSPDWNQELALCNKYLQIDERNFHVWDHRRFVVARAKVPTTEEFAYSTSKISSNFSNYSSWHYRSLLLPLIYPDPEGSRPIREDQHKKELELVHNAAFTDPNDQSAWFYQRWLLGRTKQVVAVAGAVVTRTTACVAFTQSIDVNSKAWDLELHVNEQIVPGTWSSSKDHQSHVWSLCYEGGLCQDQVSTAVILLKQVGREVDRFLLEVSNGQASGRRPSQFSVGFSDGLISVLEEELESCSQLLEMEPDSKWTLLTSVLLMQAIDRKKYKEETMTKLDQLLQVDPTRTGYYHDLRSRMVTEYAINAMEETLLKNGLPKEINLSNLNLTALYHGSQLSLLSRVDLSGNKLFRSLSQLHSLQCCSWLSLDDNQLETLKHMPKLPALQTLSLRQNKLKSMEDIKYMSGCGNISALYLKGNPIACEADLSHLVREVLPSITALDEVSL